MLARDICSGLEYLHTRNVVHRDLKPENILVSNVHYSTTINEIEKFWEDRPVIAKLTDFGESRSQFIQTSSRLHTRTNNVKRGSPIYMAPELHLKTKGSLSLNELKAVDIWALGMVLYVLVNPNLKYPFKHEMDELRSKGISSELVSHVLKRGKLPNHHPKYKKEREGSWMLVVSAFKAASKFVSSSRPCIKEVCLILEKGSDK